MRTMKHKDWNAFNIRNRRWRGFHTGEVTIALDPRSPSDKRMSDAICLRRDNMDFAIKFVSLSEPTPVCPHCGFVLASRIKYAMVARLACYSTCLLCGKPSEVYAQIKKGEKVNR